MTPDEVRKRVALIKSLANEKDYESAHAEEDSLYHDVLDVIAGGATNAQELARLVFETQSVRDP